MELIYSMRRKPLKCEPPHFESVSDPEVVRPLCQISSANIIAFSSPTELDDGDGETWGGHVYVCDLDTPWDCHKVTSTNYPVTVLEWDVEGRQLLVATTVGHVAVYGQKEFLLNEWMCLYEANFPGEHILSGILFDSGRRVVQTDKKSDVIADRVQARYTPTLKGFGGVAQDGALIVTSSGVVGVLLADQGTPPPPPDCLRAPRETLSAAYTEHHNGKILIAYVSGRRGCVRAAAAALRPALQLTPLPALHLNQPAVLSWVIRDDTECLLAAGATLSLWRLSERAHPVHKLLSKGPVQGSTIPGGAKNSSECFNTLSWHQTTAWQGAAGGCVRAAWRRGAAAVSPRAVHAAAHDSSRITTYQLINPNSTDVVPAGGSSPKKAKYSQGNLPPIPSSTVLSCVSISPCGALAVVVDSRAQIHVLSLFNSAEIASPQFLQWSQSRLELSLIQGEDYLDLLLALRPPALDQLYDRITESFQRQPAAFQQYYFHRWLALRMALTRLSPNAQCSAAWLSSLQVLHATWAAAAAAGLHDFTDETDSEKSLLQLEARCESESALSALRRPLQRAADVALAAALARRHRSHHGYDLLNDPSAAALLRRLAVAARGARAGTRADLAARTLPSDKLTNDVLEECHSLWGAAPWPAWDNLPRACVSAPTARQRPLVLQYGSPPEALRYAPERPPQLDGAPAVNMDSVRYLYLGGGGGGARRCGRCGGAANASRLLPDQRYAASCRCGGKWTLASNVY